MLRGSLLLKLLFCLTLMGFLFCRYIEKQNRLTRLRIEMPTLSKEVKRIEEEILALEYEVEQFESPTHLMLLANLKEYGHLKQPFASDVHIARARTTFDVKEDYFDLSEKRLALSVVQ